MLMALSHKQELPVFTISCFAFLNILRLHGIFEESSSVMIPKLSQLTYSLLYISYLIFRKENHFFKRESSLTIEN